MHSDKDIVAIVEIVIDSEPPIAPIRTTYPWLLHAKTKTTVVGGPDRLDHGGPPRYMGCEYSLAAGTDKIQRTQVQVMKACFVDDNSPDCVIPPPYQKPDPTRPPIDQELARCGKACSTGDETKCSVYDLRKNAAASAVSRELTLIQKNLTEQNNPPLGVDATPLINLLTAGTALNCGARSLIVDDINFATLVGTVCHPGLPIPVGSPASLKAIGLYIPNMVAGVFSQKPSSKPYRAAFMQLAKDQTATVEYYNEAANGSVAMSETDPLVAVAVEKGRIMVAGEKKYCSLIKYNEREE
ncbi:hypothetical protein [Pseudomonas sp. TE12234]